MMANGKTLAWLLMMAVVLLSACGGEKNRYENADISADGDCVNAFHHLVTESLTPVNKIHRDLKSFVKSKPSANPLVIHEYTVKDDQGHTQSLSCKFKSADVMTQLTEQPVEPSTCQAMNLEIVAQARRRLQTEGQSPVTQLEFVDDEEVSLGPFYLRPWPYQVAYEKDGKTYVRAKSLTVAADSWMPVPDSFKGTFYCHLLSPGYAYELLTGAVKAPPLG